MICNNIDNVLQKIRIGKSCSIVPPIFLLLKDSEASQLKLNQNILTQENRFLEEKSLFPTLCLSLHLVPPALQNSEVENKRITEKNRFKKKYMLWQIWRNLWMWALKFEWNSCFVAKQCCFCFCFLFVLFSFCWHPAKLPMPSQFDPCVSQGDLISCTISSTLKSLLSSIPPSPPSIDTQV